MSFSESQLACLPSVAAIYSALSAVKSKTILGPKSWARMNLIASSFPTYFVSSDLFSQDFEETKSIFYKLNRDLTRAAGFGGQSLIPSGADFYDVAFELAELKIEQTKKAKLTEMVEFLETFSL